VNPVGTRTAAGTFVRRHFQVLATWIQVGIDAVVVLLACLVGFEVGSKMAGPGAEVPIEVYVPLWWLIVLVSLVCFHGFGMYRTVKSLLNIEEFAAITKSTGVCFLLVIALMVFLRSPGFEAPPPDATSLERLRFALDFGFTPEAYSRVTIGITFTALFLLTCLSRLVSFKVIQSLYRRGLGNRNAVVIGTGETARWLTRKFLLVPTLGLRLRGFVTMGEASDEPGATIPEVGTEVDGVPVVGTVDELPRLVRELKINEAFVAVPSVEEDTMMRVVEELDSLGVTYRVVPRFYQLLSQKVRIETLDSIPLITRAVRRLSLPSAIAKRLLDLLLASIGVVILAPFFLLAAVLVKRDTPGPVFYRQVRIGKDGQPFEMLKFRTMYIHMSGDAVTPSSEHDPRITPIGRLLRRYSLDEMPQLFNVLKGQMSMVGPRPEMPFIVDQYGPLERERLRAKPGITGLWQISYARNEAIHENLDYDIYYVENRSLLLDVVILFLTLFAIVKGTGAH
jgi:exopolysaccharide biosynthesis polyprenyl glycosylphosphotransferase